MIFSVRCGIEDKRQENSSKAKPNGQYHRTLFGEHIIISFQINDENQYWQNIEQIIAKRGRYIFTFSIIRFTEEMLLAPAIFLNTKQNKGQVA